MRVGLQLPGPACPSRLCTKLCCPRIVELEAPVFQPPPHSAPSRIHLGHALRGDEEFASPRVLDMFPVDEAALRSQHRIACTAPTSPQRAIWRIHRLQWTARERRIVEVEPHNGQTLALPLSSQNTPPRHPALPMQAMPSAGLPEALHAWPGSGGFLTINPKTLHALLWWQRRTPRSRAGFPASRSLPCRAMNQPLASLSVLSCMCSRYHLCFEPRKFFNRSFHNVKCSQSQAFVSEHFNQRQRC